MPVRPAQTAAASASARAQSPVSAGSCERWTRQIPVNTTAAGMMIVIPMFIQTPTFGAIYSSLLNDDATNAIVFAGILLAIAAVTMRWIKEPPIVRDVDEVLAMPAGH
jgi:hypothetical protein